MTSLSASPEVTESFESVRTQIENLQVEKGIPSVSVAVAHRGKILWEEGFGWADIENRVPATEHTMYSLASISKPITTTGLMVLAQAGKIDVEIPVNDYLGIAKLLARIGDGREATVRQLGDHTTGLPSHFNIFFDDESFRRPSMDETIARYGNLNASPGERFEYSNLGYGVLDYIISRASGLTFNDFMRKEVFLKLGMTHSSIDIGPGLEKYQAVRYDQGGLPIPFYESDHPGASSAYSSAHDLIRFGMFHLKDHLPEQIPILTDASIDEMHRPTSRSSGEAVDYGMGWGSKDRDGYWVVSHSGGMPGVATSLVLVPAEDLAVVVLLNTADVASSSISDSILKIFLPNLKDAPVTPEPTLGLSAAMPELTGIWEGNVFTYNGDLPLRLDILADGHVHVRLGNQLTTILNEVQFKDSWLEGKFTGSLGTPEADRRRPPALTFSLKHRNNDVLSGSTRAKAIEGVRMIEVRHWTHLRRTNS